VDVERAKACSVKIMRIEAVTKRKQSQWTHWTGTDKIYKEIHYITTLCRRWKK
tara:strand:- start:421 stop:579 length:159 start_codon:yes stop_codon:yes gene_type:complete